MRRRGVYVKHVESVDGGRSPNRYVPEVTVEVRVFLPPGLGHEGVARALLTRAYMEAYAQLHAEVREDLS
jgi:hypothetical protein